MKLMTIKEAYKAPSGAYRFYADLGNGIVQVNVDQDGYDEPGTYTVMEVDGDNWIWMEGSMLIEYELTELIKPYTDTMTAERDALAAELVSLRQFKAQVCSLAHTLTTDVQLRKQLKAIVESVEAD